jgi:hypothetical protein
MREPTRCGASIVSFFIEVGALRIAIIDSQQ